MLFVWRTNFSLQKQTFQWDDAFRQFQWVSDARWCIEKEKQTYFLRIRLIGRIIFCVCEFKQKMHVSHWSCLPRFFKSILIFSMKFLVKDSFLVPKLLQSFWICARISDQFWKWVLESLWVEEKFGNNFVTLFRVFLNFQTTLKRVLEMFAKQ